MTEPKLRLQSLDALRGFDMFWIIGGGALLEALRNLTGWRFFRILAEQQEHAAWNGFRFEDLIFPLFLFISGVTIPFSLGRDLERGVPRARIHRRILRRGVLLVLLGLVYNGIFRLDFANQRYPSVLARIGIAWALGALIAVHARPRRQALWIAGILLGYWAVMKLVPVPGFGAGVLTQEGSLAGYLDRHLLPGRLYLGDHDPEGLLATVPAVATALLGSLTGHYLRATRDPGPARVLRLALAGLSALALGWLWNPLFPVNKNLWTSSFVLVAGGWSLLLLALAHYLVDLRGWARGALPFVLIGLNPITIYLAQEGILDFEGCARFFLGGALAHLGAAWAAVAAVLGVIALKLLFLAFLHRQRIYLKV